VALASLNKTISNIHTSSLAMDTRPVSTVSSSNSAELSWMNACVTDLQPRDCLPWLKVKWCLGDKESEPLLYSKATTICRRLLHGCTTEAGGFGGGPISMFSSFGFGRRNQ
jgi:hypothetical protein